MLTTTSTEALILLRQLFEADPQAMNVIFNTRFVVNEALADHPTVQVAEADDGTYSVGLIGLLNGFFAHPDGWGALGVLMEDFDKEAFRGKVVGFAELGPGGEYI